MVLDVCVDGRRCCAPTTTSADTRIEMTPSDSVCSVQDIPDLRGQVMVVAGGDTDVGKEIAKVRLFRMVGNMDSLLH